MTPRLRHTLPALWLALLLPAVAQAQIYRGVELVKAGLLADTTAITPGKPFTVGLRLKMAPKWHTYWEYSGDAGLPTKIAWTLPEGFKAGAIQWPVPQKIVSPGDIINYGYSDEVVLLTEIIPAPALAPGGTVTLKAEAKWLVCEDLCIPGSASLSLDLPTAEGGQAANAETFAKYRALLAKAGGQARMRRSADQLEIAITAPLQLQGETLEFFPLPPKGLEIGHPAAPVRQSETITVALPLVGDAKEVGGVRGVLVESSSDSAERIGYAVTEGATAAAIVKPTFASTAAAAGGSGLWHFLLVGFLGGLILNVMPCVLPVISLKLFSFVKQANEEPARILRMGLAYAAGVFAWFLGFAGLVVGLKSAGHEVGYAFHLQNPWFILGLAALVFAFSLNLLGVFEITLPDQLGGALGEASQRNEGYSGAFFQGVLATVLGSACTAPFFGAALGFAFAQKAPAVFAMFAAIAAGMSLPFVLLAARPGWLRFLPRPGVWMERVKQATGFLMLATVLWLLSILGAMRGADAVVGAGVLLLMVGAAAWIRGAFVTLSSPAGRNWLLGALGLALILGGGFYAQRAVAQGSVARGGASGSFTTQLDAALKTNQPVFVDFTAAWCVNCKVNERAVLSTAPVQQALKDASAAFLTADWTDGDPGITALLKKFGRAGVPLYVIYPADRNRPPIVLPEFLTNQMVIDGLKSATENQKVASVR